MKHRVITPNANISDAALLAKGGTILKGLADIWQGPGGRPEFLPHLAQLTEAYNKYHDGYDAAINHDTVKIADRKAARAEFCRLLEIAAKFVDASAGDDINILLRSGFDLAKPRTRTVKITPLPAPPMNFVVQQGETRGTLVGSMPRPDYAVCFEVHVAEGDPTVEGNWSFAGVHFHPDQMRIIGREPGKQISLRVKGHNAQGESGWSNPFTIIPT
jgi:hypothetical protein